MMAAMFTRSQIAGGATLVALGALGAVALGASTAPRVTTTQAPAPPPVEVRTVVVRRTVKVVRHEQPKRPAVHSTPAAAPPPVPVQQPVQVAQTRPAYTPAVTTKPLSTKTSGAAGGGSGTGGEGDDNGGGGDD